MRTPAQQAASRANGARSRGPNAQDAKPRSSMFARSLNLLAKVTVAKKESLKGFQDLVRQHMLCLARRNVVEQDAVEEMCSATWRLCRLRAVERKAIDLELATQSSPDDLGCMANACGAVAAKNPRIRPLRQTVKKEFGQNTPVGHIPSGPPAGRPAAHPVRRSLYPWAFGHTFLSPERWLAASQNLTLPRSRKNPRRTQEGPKKNLGRTQENPPKPTNTRPPSRNRRFHPVPPPP